MPNTDLKVQFMAAAVARHSTSRLDVSVHARLLGEAILAFIALVVLAGAVITLAEPAPPLGSVPVVIEVTR